MNRTKILIINPNTSEKMTDKIRAVAEAAKRDDCQVVVTCPDRGPITIESSYDEAYAIGPTVDLVKRPSEQEEYDAIILASGDMVAIDAEAVRILQQFPGDNKLGVELESMPQLRIAQDIGLGTINSIILSAPANAHTEQDAIF